MDCGQDLFGDGSGLWIRLHDPGVVCHMSCLSVEGLEDDCLGVPLLLRIGNVYFELLLLLGMQGWVHIQYWGRISLAASILFAMCTVFCWKMPPAKTVVEDD